MRVPRLILAVVFAAVLLTSLCAADSPWLAVQFVWGSPRIEVQSEEV